MARRGRLTHQLLSYSSAAELLSVAVPFIRDGQRRGERTASINSEERNRQLKQALGAEADAVLFIDSLDWYRHPMWTLAAYHRYLFDSPARTRIVAEVPWQALEHHQLREWHRFEAVSNLAFDNLGAWLICAYDTDRLGDPILDRALRTHPQLLSQAGRARNPRYQDPRDFCLSEPPAFGGVPPGAERLEFNRGLSHLRQFVQRQAHRLGLSADRAEVLMLAAGEIGANSVEHGGGRGEVSVWKEGLGVVCQISDGGAGLSDPLAGYLPPDPDLMEGCGIWLVRQLCDLVEVSSGPAGTAVRLTVKP